MRIKGQILQICCTCLSTDRGLVSLALAGQQKLFSTLFDIEFDFTEDLICWECLAIFKKIQEFQNQVFKAQNIVRSWDGKPLKSLSHLTRHTKNQYDNTYTHTELIIKTEPPHPKPRKRRTRKKLSINIDNTNTDPGAHSSNIFNVQTEFSPVIKAYFMQLDNIQPLNTQEPLSIKLESSENKPVITKTDTDAKPNFSEHIYLEDCGIEHNIDGNHLQQGDVMPKNDKTIQLHYASKKGREDSYRTEKMSEEEMKKAQEDDRNIPKFKSFRYRCETCIMGYFDETSYNKHLSDRHSEDAGDHICYICQQRFKRVDTLAIHTAIHYRKYCCNFCEFSDTRLRRMITHLYTHEAKPKCDLCNKIFQTPRALKYHLNSAHHKEKYKCDICNKTYMVKSSLAKHITAVHCSEDVKIECKVCGKRVNKRIMHLHMQKHAPPEENAYCIECDRRFRNAICLRRHLKWSPKHMKKEDYQHTCDVCGMKFIAKNRYLKHYTVTHLRQYPFKCDYCDKGFSAKKTMEQHIVVKHYGGTVTLKKDKLCDICGKGFLTRYILRIHMRTHTGEKPETCHLCGASFAQSGSLRNHHKIVHLGIRPLIKNKRVYKKKKRSKKEKAQPLERDAGMFVNAH